ncbi:tripartite motif-containing protein 44 [Oryzias latipes]|uniref:Tripartite motif containing 44 n=1 Tax=Oryzias latipes TaxID=8090 RepID=A0A3B3ICD8_ORYLA|nr:tripartite motif-containing protein 44 [Oryzias latipes]
MDHKGELLEGAMGPNQEELPQMDGSCDACEPDEAQPATLVCHICSFAFCPVHADEHCSSTCHTLVPYDFKETQPNGPVTEKDSTDRGKTEEKARGGGANQGAALDNGGDGGEAEAAQSPSHQHDEPAEEAEGAGAGPDAEKKDRDIVTVERLRCKEHGQEGSLYCKADEKIICVVCAVQGEHKGHEIITLHEAYALQKSKQGSDLLGYTQQMAERIKIKWTSPDISKEELEEYVNSQFDELRKLVHLEERRTLHLVDLKEAFLTASAAEKIAEITSETEKLQEEMDNITQQLCLLEQAEAVEQPMGPAEVLAAVAGPARMLHNIEARPRLPEPRANPLDQQDFKDNDSGPSMDHAP